MRAFMHTETNNDQQMLFLVLVVVCFCLTILLFWGTPGAVEGAIASRRGPQSLDSKADFSEKLSFGIWK